MYYKNGTVYGSQQAIRNDMKEVSLPHFMSEALIAELGYVTVVELAVPEYDTATQYVVEGEVELVNGVPTKGYIVIDKSPEQIEAENVVVVPTEVTPRQARLALLDAGLLDEIEALGKTDREFSIWFEYSLVIERNHPKVEALGESFGLTAEQIDGLFVAAAAKI